MGLDPISTGFEFGKSLVSYLGKWIPDADKAQQAAVEIQSMANNVILSQIELNKAEQVNPSLFVSGWRPATGWVCLGGLGYQIILRPIVQSVLWLWYPQFQMVSLELETLMTLLFGMLGLGAYRTAEKIKGVA